MSIPSFVPSWSSDPWYGGNSFGGSSAPSTSEGWNPFAPVVQGSIDGFFDLLETPVLPLKFDGYDYEASTPALPSIPNNGATVPDDTTVPGASSSASTMPDSGPLFSDTQDQLSGLPDLSDIGDYFAGLLASTGDLQQDAARFNAEQAQLNRRWQEHMSSTAYRRATEDLRKAGLNPILAAGAHSAATTPTGGAASVNASSGDTVSSLISAIGSLASSIADFLPSISKSFSEVVSSSTNKNYNWKMR